MTINGTLVFEGMAFSGAYKYVWSPLFQVQKMILSNIPSLQIRQMVLKKYVCIDTSNDYLAYTETVHFLEKSTTLPLPMMFVQLLLMKILSAS